MKEKLETLLFQAKANYEEAKKERNRLLMNGDCCAGCKSKKDYLSGQIYAFSYMADEIREAIKSLTEQIKPEE